MDSRLTKRLDAYLVQNKDMINMEIKEHSERVEKYAKMIVDNTTTKYDREFIGLCGRYHDIGKCFINEYYPDVLTTEFFKNYEKDVIRQHTIMGVELLYEAMLKENIRMDKELERLTDAILFHHENLDGSGYLHRKTIPEVAQIIAVADRFSAGIEKRLYHEAKSPQIVIAEMKSAQEELLNQEYVKALEKGLEKEKIWQKSKSSEWER